jgi:hypothetical protein
MEFVCFVCQPDLAEFYGVFSASDEDWYRDLEPVRTWACIYRTFLLVLGLAKAWYKEWVEVVLTCLLRTFVLYVYALFQFPLDSVYLDIWGDMVSTTVV